MAIFLVMYGNLKYYCQTRHFLITPGELIGEIVVDKKNLFFRQVTRLVCSSLDIEVSLTRCLLYLGKHLPADEIYLSLYEPGLSAIKVVAQATKDSGKLLNTLIPVSKDIRLEIENTELQNVRIINHPELDTIAKAITPTIEKSNHSALVMQLKIEDELLGVLLVCAKGKNRYMKEDADLLSIVADPFTIAISNALRYQEVTRLKDMLADDNRYLRRELRHLSGGQIIGEDFGLKEVLELVRRIAPLNNPVMLLGETGTGKEIITNAIHYSSHRKNGPMIRVNCGAIPETLIDDEFFGHDKGAFTGAISTKKGKFERAHKGTLLLDEIGELLLNAQVRLLRVIQSRVIERVGGTQPIPVDVRLIVATHRNLEAMVKTGQFREDLWFRLNVFPITIPPLRQRKNDIPALVQHFIERNSKEAGTLNLPTLAPNEMDSLLSYHWPGNVRELENVVERAMILCMDNVLTFNHFATTTINLPSISAQDQDIEDLNLLMTRHIKRALRQSKGKVHGPKGAAAMLKINPSTLRNRMRKLGIRFGKRQTPGG